MKNPIIVVAAIIVLVVGGIAVFTQLNKSSDSNMTGMNSNEMKNSDTSKDMMSEEDLTGQKEVTMDIKSFDFQKANIKIKVGTKVTWTNQDSAKHNVVTEGDGAEKLSSKLLAKGESYSYTFTNVGMTDYLCEPHPYMKAKVNVVE